MTDITLVLLLVASVAALWFMQTRTGKKAFPEDKRPVSSQILSGVIPFLPKKERYSLVDVIKGILYLLFLLFLLGLWRAWSR